MATGRCCRRVAGRWEDVFGLPEAALAGSRRVPKAVLARQAGLTRLEQRSLERVGRIEHLATVQKSTTRILPHVDGERDIQAIVVLRAALAAGSAAFAETARLLHKSFPNPTVIVLEGAGSACVSAVTTRRSLAEQGATVVDEETSTGAFDPGDPAWAGLLDALSLSRLPQADLLAYLEGVLRAIRLSRAIPVTGSYPSCDPARADELMRLIAEHDGLEAEVRAIRAQRADRSISLNETARLRMRMKEADGRRGRVAEEIREICNG